MNFEELRRLASGFQPSALFIASLEMGLFDALKDGPLDDATLAARIGADARSTRIAANALAALGLLVKDGGVYANSPEAGKWLVATSDDYRGSILRHIGGSWGDYAEIGATWKKGSARCERKEGQVPADDEGLEHFILGMENMTREAAPMLAARLPLAGRKAVLDIGAGPGNYCLAFAAAAPEARVVHFDLPRTSDIARRFVAGKPGADRIEFVSGDFLTDSIGENFDFIWMSQIIHMLSDDEARALISKAAGALLPNGMLAVHDHFLDDTMTSPVSAALFGVHMMTVTKGGRAYSFAETEEWMELGGLKNAGRIDYGGPSRITTGIRRG